MSLAVEFRAQTLRHSPQGPCPLSTLAAVVQPRFKCLCECAQWLTPPQMRAHACASLMTTKYKLGRRYTTSTRRSGPPLPRTTCTRQLFGAACRVPWTVCTPPCLRALVDRDTAATHECTHALGTCRYGQTGSGKTFTMLGDERAKLGPVLEATHGMLPRAMHHIFNSCAHGSSSPEVHLTAAQIYRERITDLLVESLPAPALKLRERAGEVFVDGLRSVRVRTAPEAMVVLVGAASRRCTSSTVHNEVSSRSHAVFTLWIQHPGKAATQLNFVDLAGSERLDGMRGSRAEESIAINSSLLALAGVIGALTEGIAGWHSRLTGHVLHAGACLWAARRKRRLQEASHPVQRLTADAPASKFVGREVLDEHDRHGVPHCRGCGGNRANAAVWLPCHVCPQPQPAPRN